MSRMQGREGGCRARLQRKRSMPVFRKAACTYRDSAPRARSDRALMKSSIARRMAPRAYKAGRRTAGRSADSAVG